MIFLTEDELLPNISKRIQVISREDNQVIERVMPVWQAVALGGVLKLIKNRIRYNALMNFLKTKVNAEHLLILENDGVGYDEIVLSYGEALIGILFPDKKSAIAISLSQKMHCKSSFLLKGLTYFLGILCLQLKKDEEQLSDFPFFCEQYLAYAPHFSNLISADLQKSIIEILLLNDVLKADDYSIFTESFDESEALEQGFLSKFLNKKLLLFIGVGLLFIIVSIYLTQIKSKNTVEVEQNEDIIPLDSLNKLNDSLTQVAIDSTKLQTDSTVSLSWTAGKSFTIPKQSSIVQLHSFLTDSTTKEPLVITCNELSFNSENDQLISTKDYFFKRFTEGLQLYKDVKIEIFTFSEKDGQSQLKRGFLLKNRLVGEGISPKRMSVSPSGAGISPDKGIPLNAQVIFKIVK